ncbi:beta-glucan synthesis-associated protein [Coniothyrium glycines]
MAAPLKRAASHQSSLRSTSHGLDDVEQHGRSTTSLMAQREAAVLRGTAAGDAQPAVQPDARAPDQQQQQQNNRLSAATQSSAASDTDFDFGLSPHPHAPSPPQHPSLFSPAVPSPLNPTTSLSSHNGDAADQPREGNLLAQRPADRPRTAATTPGLPRPIPRPSLRQLQQHGSTPDLLSEAMRSPSNPLTLQDLGSDYTRYFNPFSDAAATPSARSSFSLKRSTSALPLLPPAALSGANTPRGGADSPNPFLTPNASTTKLNTLYDSEKNLSYVNDRLTAPYEEKGMAGWPLINDPSEPDDEMHMPRDDDDIKYRPKLSDHFSRDSIISTIGLAFMLLGLLFLFIGLPVLSALGVIDYNSSFGVPLSMLPNPYRQEAWATVNNRDYPLLQNIRKGLIDPDTPKSALTKKGQFGDDYVLVFSDEFNDNNRTFYEGDDPYFFAGDFWYGATQDLEWYDPDAVTTYDGTLELRLDKMKNHGLEFRSGMLNSWNQLCFKGGIFEVSVSLPGPGGVPGLWPGAWTMGNLGRPGYLSTTDGMWPYTYQACDVGITPNQSSSDGLSRLPGQRLNSCTCKGEDHPTPGTGRGAPEIDVIEVGATYPPHNMPIATQSFQVAPFDVYWYPNYNFTAFPDYSMSWYNGYTGGPFQQAISATTNLNKDWYDGVQYQRYSFEYAPGEGPDAFISWQVGDQPMFMMDGRAIGPNGNIQARQISEEPMSLILNLGISNSWTWIDWDHMVFPAVMRVDYVRWYQKEGEEMVTCDPPGFETTDYIKKHKVAYTNPNLTEWDDTGYGWPKHKLNTDC